MQGNGDDFTETFDDDKYNPENLYIGLFYDLDWDFDFRDPKYTRFEDGKLVIDDEQKTRIATRQTYSDFELTMTLSDFSGVDKSVWGVTFARFSVDEDKLAMDGKMTFQFNGNGSIVCINGPLVKGGGAPVPYVDSFENADGEMENYTETLCVYTHDYTKGALTLKFRKEDDVLQVYAYCKEGSAQALTPFATFTGCYFAGHLDVGLLHSGAPSSMTLDSLTVKNLDVNKGKLKQVDDNHRVELSYEKEEDYDPEDDTPGEDVTPGGEVNPGGNETTPNKGGCGGNIASESSFIIVSLLFLSAIAFILFKKAIKRKN